MRRVLSLVLLFCLHLACGASAQDQDFKDLLGTWDEVTPERARERVGYRVAPSRVPLTFCGSACIWGEPGGAALRQSLFIPVRVGSQRGLDFVTVSSGAFWTTRALFKIEGDTLTIKEGALDKARPTDFAPWEFDGQNADSMALLHVYKRRVK